MQKHFVVLVRRQLLESERDSKYRCAHSASGNDTKLSDVDFRPNIRKINGFKIQLFAQLWPKRKIALH